ncbi:BCAM0308 family protein [Thiovibrio sp. JS02]
MEKGQNARRDRLIQEKRHDAYKEWEKWPEPTVCPECRALFLGGRWSWEAAPPGAKEKVCPACQRIADAFPAGLIEIQGAFHVQHWQEIHNLLRNTENLEKSEHPMERIMTIAEQDGGHEVTTTGIHLARRIGEALKHSYQGELDLAYGDGEQSLRVTWRRD